MTLRAFFVGLIFVGMICLITPYNDFDLANTYMTGFHFPVGAFFLLVVMTLAANLCLKLVRTGWAFARPELMLIWCMMIIASTVPSSGLMRYWFPMMAAPRYYAEQKYPDWVKDGHVLSEAPTELILSGDAGKNAADYFYRGTKEDEKLRIPWGPWVRPLATWAVFLLLYYLAIFFMGGMLRGRWVDAERLTFPLAKVPLELTEGSAGESLLPRLVRNRYFLVGAAVSLAFGLIRIFVMESVQIQLRPLLAGSFLQHAQVNVAYVFPLAMGFAFLLPAQISFSLWFFFLLTRFEHLGAYHFGGSPLKGGDYAPFMQWQQAGAFIAFAMVILWKARHHLLAVVRKATGRGAEIDDSEEPISHGLSFWGFVICFVGMIGWCWYFEMNPLVALLLLALMFILLLVHARLVCQGGLFFTQQNWAPVQIVHSITGGFGLSAPALVVANMQHSILMSDAREVLSPHAMNALRISSVFRRKRRRLLLPAMLAALLLGIAVAGWSSMRVYYSSGGLNVSNRYGPQVLAPGTFQTAERQIMRAEKATETHFLPLGIGMGVMIGLLAVRMACYWWPLHPIGLLVATTYAMGTMYLSFFLGWLVKVLVTRFGGGRVLKHARSFFLGVIVMEAFQVGACAVVGYILKERIAGYMFLPG